MKKGVKIFLSIACVLSSVLVNTAKSQEVITDIDLYNHSRGNEAAFDAQFTGKTLKVRGTVIKNVVKNTKQPWNKGYSLWLGWSRTIYSDDYNTHSLEQRVRLFITESDARQFANVQIGDEIIIQGRCIGKGGSLLLEYSANRADEVFISNCILIKSNAEIKREEELERARRWEAERPQREAAERERAERQKAEREAADRAKREAEEAEKAKRKAEETAQRAKREAAKKAEQKAERIAEWAEKRKEENRIWREKEERKREEEQRRQEEEERKAGVVKRTFKFGEGKETSAILPLSKPELRPQYAISQEEGIIVIDVVVEVIKTLVPAGMVTKAKIDEKRTTIKDQAIRNSALEKLRREKFPTVTQRTKGTVTYTFSH
jgi:flagellar biosynthesis GTPase FlhF